jgi:uncharacterized protein YdeI (BOF family)
MKNNSKIKLKLSNLTSILVLIFTLTLISGCSKTENYGEALTGTAPGATVKQILDNPENYENKTITLKGEIKEVCPAGCWFFVNDDFGELYVNIGPAGFAIPNKMGHKVKIEGEIINHKGTMMLMGKGVEIK